jgi:hypothetical protein
VAENRDEAAEMEAVQVSLREGLERAKELVNEARHQIAEPWPAPPPEPPLKHAPPES